MFRSNLTILRCIGKSAVLYSHYAARSNGSDPLSKAVRCYKCYNYYLNYI
jgi:hypothetical protein